MGSSDDQIAKLWQLELARANIDDKGIDFISENLGRLEKPEFIPNVFQLINLYKNNLSLHAPRKPMLSIEEANELY